MISQWSRNQEWCVRSTHQSLDSGCKERSQSRRFKIQSIERFRPKMLHRYRGSHFSRTRSRTNIELHNLHAAQNRRAGVIHLKPGKIWTRTIISKTLKCPQSRLLGKKNTFALFCNIITENILRSSQILLLEKNDRESRKTGLWMKVSGSKDAIVRWFNWGVYCCGLKTWPKGSIALT
jgi:hypothetical protein